MAALRNADRMTSLSPHAYRSHGITRARFRRWDEYSRAISVG